MSAPSVRLRLGPLPKGETYKITISISGTLKTDLERYAALHSRIYGRPVTAEILIPHMLQAFIARDRGFSQSQSKSGLGGTPA